MRLTESLIKKLEADIRRGLNDAQLRKKHDIPEPTWRRWKNKGKKDRYNELTTIYITLLDKLREGREEITEQIKNVLVKVALGEWMYVTTKTYKDASGEIIKTVEKIATEPDLKAVKFMLNYLDPEHWGEHKKTEITRINVIVPKSVEEDEWLRECILRQTKLTQPKEAEKQPEQREGVVKPIEYAVVERALGEWEYVTTERYKDESGKIIKTVEQTTTRPDFKAAKRWLSYLAPEHWGEHKKPGISSIGDIVPNPRSMTEEEWLQEYGNKQTNPTQPKEAEKQPVYTFNSTRTGADMTKLRKSLIKKLEAYIGRELGDTQLRKKHDIPEATWRRWKRRGATDRQNGLTTIYTMLLDRLWEGREEVVKQIENAIVERALGIRKRVSIRAWKDESGEIIGTVERTTTPPPNLKAVKRWLSYYDPEHWGEHKKTGISSIGDIVPNPEPITEEEWLQKYGNKQTNPTQPKEAEKQPEQKEKDEAE